jgi:ABC-2 type transport system permease protein
MVMRANLRLFWSGVRSSWANYLVYLTPGIYLGVHIPRRLLQALFFVLIAKAAGGNELARFALIGNAVQIAAFVAVFSMTIVIEAEKWNNTLQYLIASPSNWLPIMLGKGMADYGDSLVGAALVFAVLPPVLGIHLPIIPLLASVPVILITVFSASALGWLIGAIALPIRWGNLISNMMGYAMMIVCGVNFPITALPPAVQCIGNMLPVTHGLQAIRMIIDGSSYIQVLPKIGLELLVAFAYTSVAWLIFGYRLKVIRKRGSFELI